MQTPSSDKARTRILFVDDEPLLLQGLERMLRTRRHVWEMAFANCAEDALAKLAASPFDVIVTDMRMPGTDGAKLLKRVQELYPQVVRIVLSGYFEREAALRAVPVAHQFLAKPCDPAQLQAAVERLCGYCRYLSDEATRRVVGAIGDLPVLPRHTTSLLKSLENSETPMNEVSRLIERDVGMTAKVLQLTNSAFFGPSREVTSVRMAVSYLGLDVLKTLVLSAEILGMFHVSPRARGFSFEGFQEHSGLSARIASRLPLPRDVGSSAVAAALLHDVGILVLAARLPETFDEILTNALDKELPLHQVEVEILGTTHAEIGAYLLGLWGLPLPIVNAVGRHHQTSLGTQALRGLDVVSAVQIADILALESQIAYRLGYPLIHEPLDPDYLNALGVTEELAAWREIAQEAASVSG